MFIWNLLPVWSEQITQLKFYIKQTINYFSLHLHETPASFAA